VITWSLPANTSNLTLSATSGETVTAESVDNTSGGDIVITVATADITNSHTVHIHDVDLYLKENVQGDEAYQLVTNKTISTANANPFSSTVFNVKLDFSCKTEFHDNNLSVTWGFEEQENNMDGGGAGTLTLSNASEMTVDLTRGGWNINSPKVTGFVKYNSSTACYLSFIANDT
ncbi:MAG: hypothetical protein IAA72_01685, partial [Spirochaetes bacterium]|nr:hypothetical protein [Candidatus Ornithospirochaeta stercoravium]